MIVSMSHQQIHAYSASGNSVDVLSIFSCDADGCSEMKVDALVALQDRCSVLELALKSTRGLNPFSRSPFPTPLIPGLSPPLSLSLDPLPFLPFSLSR